ncbi:MAG: Blue-light-activated protein [Syntrophorhabdus sp. PtaU1.Bin153]|nr:MAG: Blue-light-activated protein [Syntrophorhabdus sp. PtaU1.Bin153]
MQDKRKTREQLLSEMAELRHRNAELEKALTDLKQAGEHIDRITGGKQAEADLAGSERKYRELVQNVNSVILRWTRDGTITFINEYGRTFFGYATDELIGRNVNILVPKQDSTGADLTRLVQDLVDHPERHVNNINENVCKDGSLAWMSWTNKPILHENGTVAEILAIGSDVTRQKRAEQALQDSETRLSEAQRIAHLGNWDFDIRTGDVYWSCEIYRIFGVTQKDFPATYRSYLDCIHPDDRRAVEEAVNASLADPRKPCEIEHRIVRPDGTERVIHGSGEVLVGKDGKPVRMLGIVLDITEHKQMEKTLRANQSRLEAIFTAIPNAMIEYDAGGRPVRANEAALRALGPLELTREQSAAKLNVKNLDGTTIPADNLPTSRALRGETAAGEIYSIRTADGIDRVISIYATPLYEDGKIDGIVTLWHDVTELKHREEELRKLRDELELRVRDRTAQLKRQAELLDLAHDAVILSDTDGRIVFWNNGALDTYGFTREETLGEPVHRLLRTQSSNIPIESIVDKVKRGGRWEGELVHTRKDGRQVTVHSRWALRHDEITGSTEIMEVNRDITLRKLAEEAAKAERQRLYAVLETLPAYVVLLTPDYRVSFANRVFRKLFGDPRHKFCFQHLFGRTEPCEVCRTYEALKTATPQRWQWTGPNERTYDIHDFPFTDATGSVLILEMGIDITDRKRAEDEIRSANAYNRGLIEASVDPLVTIDPEGKISDVNIATERVTGHSREKLIGADFSDHFTDPEKARAGYQLVFKEGLVRDYELEIRHKDGHLTPVLYNASVYRDEIGKVIGVFAAARDISAQRQLEEQLRQAHKMEAIGTLAGGIAHDFNNILAAIIGFSEMVEEDLPPASPSLPRIQRVLRAASRGRDLVRQILAFSRKTEPTRTPVPLSPLVEETAQLLRASLPATIAIKLSMRATKDAVVASPAELQQILMNLCTNASFAMREKGGILRISITNIDFEPDSPILDENMEPREYIQLRVTDTGTGMPPEVKKRVFEPFFTTKDVGVGTGMGLAVVYGVVKSLGGAIAVESEPGAGSTFRVFLPVAGTDEKPEDSKFRTAPKGMGHILFVDDEELLREWAQSALERLGYSVTALADSTEALKLFSSDPYRFNLVITDHTMPKLTGLNLARRLLTLRTDMPIILCTGHSDSVTPQKAKEAGIKEFIMKPVTRQELAEAIRRALSAIGTQD